MPKEKKKRICIYLIDGGEIIDKIEEIEPTYNSKGRHRSEIVTRALKHYHEFLLAQ